jgi:DNA-directed RNA polymerase subunit RPC12/RpoP
MAHLNFKRYGLYLLRWQGSTPILAGVLYILAGFDPLIATIIANVIGGLIFFWVDQFIFTSSLLAAQWEVKENIRCVDCGRTARGYRLVRSKNYDKTDAAPEFRCEVCSQKKTEDLRRQGIEI